MRATCGKKARELWTRLNRECQMDIPPKSCVMRVMAGQDDKAKGAFSWMLINPDSKYHERLGSPYPIYYLLKCPKINIMNSHSDIAVIPKEHPILPSMKQIGRNQAAQDIKKNGNVIPPPNHGSKNDIHWPDPKTQDRIAKNVLLGQIKSKEKWDELRQSYNHYMHEMKQSLPCYKNK